MGDSSRNKTASTMCRREHQALPGAAAPQQCRAHGLTGPGTGGQSRPCLWRRDGNHQKIGLSECLAGFAPQFPLAIEALRAKLVRGGCKRRVGLRPAAIQLPRRCDRVGKR
jgi:hypothetical protein